MTHDWHKLKRSILERWDKLTHNDLDQVRSNKSGILNLIKKHYPEVHALPADLEAILEAHGEKFYEKHPTAPRSSETSELQDDVGNFNRCKEVQAFEKKGRSAH